VLEPVSSAAQPQTTDDTSRDGSVLTTDETFEMLSNRRRRYALHHLKQTEGAVGLGELSRKVASWECHKSPESVTSEERKRVYTSLQQFHLPKLEETGVVEYDGREGEVALAPAAEDLEVYFEVIEGRDIPWSQYYLGLSAFNAALVAAVLVDAISLPGVPVVGWVVFVVTTFGLSALAHVYYASTMRLGEKEAPPELSEDTSDPP
jgi:hypothetical protein